MATVRLAHLGAAFACWAYAEASALYVFGDALEDPWAERVLEAFRAAGTEGLTMTDLHQLCGRNTPAAALRAAIAELEAYGLIGPTPRLAGQRGRPEQRWRAIAEFGLLAKPSTTRSDEEIEREAIMLEGA